MKEWIPIALGVALALLSYLNSRKEVARLRQRLKERTLDCIALAHSEDALCLEVVDALITAETISPCKGPRLVTKPSLLAVKRAIRAKLRVRGIATPSDKATLHQLEGELRKI